MEKMENASETDWKQCYQFLQDDADSITVEYKFEPKEPLHVRFGCNEVAKRMYIPGGGYTFFHGASFIWNQQSTESTCHYLNEKIANSHTENFKALFKK